MKMYGVYFCDGSPPFWAKDPNGHIHEYFSKGAAEAMLEDIHFYSYASGKSRGEVREFPEDEE